MAKKNRKTKPHPSLSANRVSDRNKETYEAHLRFLSEEKGQPVDSVEGLKNTMFWLRSVNPDELLYGEASGDPFDIMIGTMRRGELIEAVDWKIRKLEAAKV